jgi:fermentation-respiration switch protein FrsA (DUF1100 family)
VNITGRIRALTRVRLAWTWWGCAQGPARRVLEIRLAPLKGCYYCAGRGWQTVSDNDPDGPDVWDQECPCTFPARGARGVPLWRSRTRPAAAAVEEPPF